jgi:hypothetical protein
MHIQSGLLDYSKPWDYPAVLLFTGNRYIKKDGGIVMGRGAAKQVRDSYPGIDKIMGKIVSRSKPSARVLFTDIASDKPITQILGWFQVKDNWYDNADLDLIQEATDQLRAIALRSPKVTLHMNYPGIGNGKLSQDDVQPILLSLPDNVRIYK